MDPTRISADEIPELIQAVTIEGQDTVIEAASNFAGFARANGFRIAASHDISSKRDLRDSDGNSLNETVFGWTSPHERWWERPELALNSPFVLACRYESEAWWANAKGARSSQPNNPLSNVSFEHFFSGNKNFQSLIVVPLRLPFGKIGIACFVPVDRQVTDLQREFDRTFHLFSLLANRFLNSYSRLTENKNWIPPNCVLTRRQVQCLHWAAMGKTDVETSIILSVSHASVRYHLKEAADRLDCVSRTQSVFKATQLGYIGSIDS